MFIYIYIHTYNTRLVIIRYPFELVFISVFHDSNSRAIFYVDFIAHYYQINKIDNLWQILIKSLYCRILIKCYGLIRTICGVFS